jgi:mannose-6-phosphate isomerase-like protein (cupin superfamily)
MLVDTVNADMKKVVPTVVKFSQTWEKDFSTESLVLKIKEYNSGQFDKVDIAQATISGRYPQKGFAKNTACEMLYYIVSGKASVSLKDGGDFELEPKDAFIFPVGCLYAVTGDFVALIISSPAWYPEQYEMVE